TVSWQDVIIIAGCSLGVIGFVFKNFSSLMLVSFDEDVAKVAGIRTNAINMVLSIVTAVTVVTGMMVVGILMVSALMIVPVAAAERLGKGFKTTLAWAVMFAILAVIGGLSTAFYLDIAPGGSIIMTTILFYIVATVLRHVKNTWRL
ncbi:MAG: metal ABC transporter permease, partial [Sporomusa sp.]